MKTTSMNSLAGIARWFADTHAAVWSLLQRADSEGSLLSFVAFMLIHCKDSKTDPRVSQRNRLHQSLWKHAAESY